MRTPVLPAVFVSAALLAGCGDQSPTPTESLSATVDVVFSRADPSTAGTHLSGGEEVPPVDTQAQGQLKLRLSPDGEVLSYKLIATNIDDVFMAHLHMAPAGQNGGIVLWLYQINGTPALIEGRHTGILAEGEVTSASLTGALAGKSLSELWDQIQAGNIYANVHTSAFRGGEIRGQVSSGG